MRIHMITWRGRETWVKARVYQHVYDTAHVAVTPAAAKKIRETLSCGGRLEYSRGPEFATKYNLYEVAESGRCPHCCDVGGTRITSGA